jgi:phosphotransferase family enzyme
MGQSFSIGALLPLRLRLWIGDRLFRPLGPSTVRVSWHRVIKGPCDPGEIEAMQYIASHTSIPVPRLFGVHINKRNDIYIEMEHIPGKTLRSAWSDLSKEQRHIIFGDIKHHLSSLRALKPPAEDTVCSALQNPLHDGRVGSRYFGPCSQEDFHALLRKKLIMEDVATCLCPEAYTTHTSTYKTVFTHADLNPRNIMVRNGRVVAIIDWAYSGWYPEYWEYTKAFYNWVGEEWEDYLSMYLDNYDTELTAERKLWRMLPLPGTSGFAYMEGEKIHLVGSSPSPAWLAAREARQAEDLWTLALPQRAGSSWA